MPTIETLIDEYRLAVIRFCRAYRADDPNKAEQEAHEAEEAARQRLIEAYREENARLSERIAELEHQGAEDEAHVAAEIRADHERIATLTDQLAERDAEDREIRAYIGYKRDGRSLVDCVKEFAQKWWNIEAEMSTQLAKRTKERDAANDFHNLALKERNAALSELTSLREKIGSVDVERIERAAYELEGELPCSTEQCPCCSAFWPKVKALLDVLTTFLESLKEKP